VDVADYTVAATDSGLELVRARYRVLNDRARWLRVVPPPGSRLLAARVSARAAVPVSGDQPGWLLPLPRSVEVLDGLIAVPVEVVLLVRSPAWRVDEPRPAYLPTVDAPVAVSRLTLHLPPGLAVSPAPHPARVEEFDEGEGIHYGLVVRTPADERHVDRVHDLFTAAVDAWRLGDLDECGRLLDRIDLLGADSADIQRLRRAVLLAAPPAPPPPLPDRDELLLDRLQLHRLADRLPRRVEAVAGLIDEAQAAGDVILLNCLSDKLSILRALSRIAAEARDELPRAVARGDLAASVHQERKLQIAAEQAAIFEAEAVACVGIVGSSFPGQTRVMVRTEAPQPPRPPKPRLVVRAATRTVPIPRLGEPVLFQRLLLPAGEAPEFEVRVRPTRPGAHR